MISLGGVVGFKPSYGRISLDGVVLLSPSLDTIGFLTQDVESMALAASLLIEKWKTVSIQSLPTLGVPDGKYMTFLMDEAHEKFEEQVQQLEEAGYTVKRLEMPWELCIEEVYPHAVNLLCSEMAKVHAEWVQQHGDSYRLRALKGIEHGQKFSAEQQAVYLAEQLKLRQELDQFMKEQGVDLLISPSQADSAPEGYNLTGWGGMTTPWSFVGFPTLSLPGGQVKGLPLGFQCIASFRRDEVLLSWGQGIAKVLQG